MASKFPPQFSYQKTQTPKQPPNPPKFLVISTADKKSTNIIKLEEERNAVERPKLSDPIQSGLSIPTASKFTDSKPSIDYSKPSHHYPSKVNSKTDMKGTNNMNHNSHNNKVVLKPNNIPQAPPKSSAILRPYVNEDFATFSNESLLSNRSANGRIMGNYAKHYVSSNNIPAVDEVHLGPDNPTKILNDIWTAYWDESAGASYYYNHITGEATWIKPNL